MESNTSPGAADRRTSKMDRRVFLACVFILGNNIKSFYVTGMYLLLSQHFGVVQLCDGWSPANNCFLCTAYFAVSTNLVNYLKDRLHVGSKAAANGVTNWQGTSSITPIVAAFLADAFLGRYWTIALFLLISVVVRGPSISIVVIRTKRTRRRRGRRS